jgi:hypothetical protein
MSRSPAAIVNVSPAVTATDDASASEPRKFPADEASQNEMCEYVSDAATDVHEMSAEFVIAPPEAAENVTAVRSVSVAAFEVPAEPGSPVWSLT